MILKAHAKINCHLDIGPRRKDGYHSLKTIFQEISLHDTLRFSLTNGPIQLTVSGARRLSSGPDNLIVRALTQLRDKLKIKKGMRVHLTKRIPMGAGLGGGSSDAAAALWGGWLLWNSRKSKKKSARIPLVLRKLASGLGADVPFFLRGGTAWGEGIGDRLRSMKSPGPRWLVLVYPQVHVSTPDAYRWLDESRENTGKLKFHHLRKPFNYPRHPGNLLAGAQVLPHGKPGSRPNCMPGRRIALGTWIVTNSFNSFESVILPRYPEIAKAQKVLIDQGCSHVMMSGSGSTVFGYVKNQKEGRKIIHSLPSRRWRSFLCQTV